VLLGSGGALWLTAPHPKHIDVGLVPALGPRDAGLVAQGTF
jgi:hypothetical protein